MARHQTAGRGRLDRQWAATPGANLLVSLLFREVPEHLQIDCRAAADLPGPAEEKRLEGDAPVAQVTRQDEAIPAVIPFPAEQEKTVRLQLFHRPPQEGEYLEAGVLHQDDIGHAIDPCSPAIDLPHLPGGEDFHARRSPWKEDTLHSPGRPIKGSRIPWDRGFPCRATR